MAFSGDLVLLVLITGGLAGSDNQAYIVSVEVREAEGEV
jgi:hypothetical protein